MNKNKLLISLPGTGKSTMLAKIAEDAKLSGKEILYLAFNRNIRQSLLSAFKDKYRKSEFLYFYLKWNFHTFHSFALMRLQGEYLSEKINGFTTDERKLYFEEPEHIKNANDIHEVIDAGPTNLFFNNLLSWLLEFLEEKKEDTCRYDLIIVDELQDLDDTMFKILKALVKGNSEEDALIIGAGDPKQTIYQFKKSKNAKNLDFNQRFIDFQTEFDAEVETLNKCYRSSPSIQRFANGFYIETYKNDKMLYDLSEFQPEEFTNDVYIYTVQNMSAIVEEISRIIEENKQSHIAIIARSRYEERVLKESFKNNGVTVSTIHKAKGGTFDVTILANSLFNSNVMTEAEKNVWNVAITRSKKKLYIVSSFPSHSIQRRFQEGTYTLIDKQKQYSKTEITPIEENDIKILAEKLKKSVIDSIILRLSFDEVPFVPYETDKIEGKPKPYGLTPSLVKILNLEFVIKRFKKYIYFEFTDLNPLKNEYFNDVKILTYLKEVIKQYFNHQMPVETIESARVLRLDLCQYHKAKNKIKAIKNLENAFNYFANHKHSSVMTSIYPCLKEHPKCTVYFNPVKQARSIAIYFPYYKLNENKLRDEPSLLKIEARRRYQSKGSNDSSLQYTFKEVMDLAETQQLKQTHKDWLWKEFPFLAEKPVKNSKMLMEKRGIKKIKDFATHLTKVKGALKEKKILFYIFLDHFLSESEREELTKHLEFEYKKESEALEHTPKRRRIQND